MKTDKKTRNKIAVEVFNFFKESGVFLSIEDLSNHIAQRLNLSEKEKKDRYPSGDVKYVNMIRFALLTFKKSGLIENIGDSSYELTEKGIAADYISEDEYYQLQKDVARENNKKKRREKKTQQNLFPIINNSDLTKEQISLLSEIVKQNNLIIEKVLGKQIKQ